jgi:hypothetical protein
MKPPASTMPEAKYRSTKKDVPPASSIPASEFSHEARAQQPQRASVEPESRKESKASRTNGTISIVSVWPVAVGIFLSGFAAEWYTMATQAGVWATRFTFPYTLLMMHREIAIRGLLTPMPHRALWVQIPIDGLLMTISLACGRSLRWTIVMLLLLHVACTLVLWMLPFAK